MGERSAGAVAMAPHPDYDLVELALVLPRWQVDALAAAARRRSMTAGQVLRRLIGGYCANLSAPDR